MNSIFVFLPVYAAIVFQFSSKCLATENEKITGDLKSTNSWEASIDQAEEALMYSLFHLIIYKDRHLLPTQRRAHMDVIKSILAITNTEKQYDMLDILTKKLLEVLQKAKRYIEAENFHPTDEFPEDEVLRDVVSQVIQNAVLFGDMTLRFPTFIHRVSNRSRATQALIKWAFEFTEQTGATKGTNAEQSIPLASQELNIVKRSPDYVNPYKEDAEIKLSKLVKEELEKKKGKKKTKGPRLSKKTEL